jgi:hypothetical protein
MLINVPAADKRTEVGDHGRAPIAEAYVKAKAALDALVAAMGWISRRRREGDRSRMEFELHEEVEGFDLIALLRLPRHTKWLLCH